MARKRQTALAVVLRDKVLVDPVEFRLRQVREEVPAELEGVVD
jgi:hypothetical protein